MLPDCDISWAPFAAPMVPFWFSQENAATGPLGAPATFGRAASPGGGRDVSEMYCSTKAEEAGCQVVLLAAPFFARMSAKKGLNQR
jgi:hypothetical protein